MQNMKTNAVVFIFIITIIVTVPTITTIKVTITDLWCAGVRAFEWALEAERDIDRDIDRDMLGLQHSSQDIVVVSKSYFSGFQFFWYVLIGNE